MAQKDKFVVVAAALGAETRALRKRIFIENSVHSQPLHVWYGRHQQSGVRLMILATGMGAENVRHAAGHLRREFKDADAFIIAGSCGATSKKLSLFDTLIPERVFEPSGKKLILSERVSDLLLLSRPEHLPQPLRSDLITVEDIVYTAEEKQKLFERIGASAVDMEAYVWADLCFGMGIDAAAIKGVIDLATETITAPELPPAPDNVPLDTLMERILKVSQMQAEWLESFFELV